MKIVCTNCQRLMTAQQAVTAIEMSDFGPYKLWAADLYICKGCNNEAVAGFADRAYAEHFQPHFAKALEVAIASDNVARF